MKPLYLSAFVGLAALTLPAAAEAAQAFATANVNLRAGPSTQYPPVLVVPAGNSVEIFGCLSSANWCDVGYAGYRGWISGSYLQTQYSSRRIYVDPDYYGQLGIPTVTFQVDNYWDRYYRGRDFYRERDRWRRAPPPPPVWHRDGPPPRFMGGNPPPPPPPPGGPGRYDPRMDGDRNRPGDGRPWHRPGDMRPDDRRPGDMRPDDRRPGDMRPDDRRPGDMRPDDRRPGDQRPGDMRPGDMRPGDMRPGGMRPDDPRRGPPQPPQPPRPDRGPDGNRPPPPPPAPDRGPPPPPPPPPPGGACAPNTPNCPPR
ncbi:SH3 domain-containing protein [Allorhizobium taibaishanense]|uniref:Uncharacterized protein YraI n=1 Tax=Allorhizobium taibaishanense TaxID=887144 RepID=A0A7W6HQ61_9HYPH|nr:SH3 domain-containing protein [Allorhizobium taibaishanense]MBB4009326.1 uncharacterized protein YraI [Allorhizobium taibaishanense]